MNLKITKLKIMKKSILVMKSLVLAGALFFVSCNDDDGFTCPEAITGELNSAETAFAGTWVLSKMDAEDAIDLTNDNESNPSKDLFSQYSECDRDLVYDFESDRKYSNKMGTIAQDCTNKVSLVGTWGLTSANVLTLVANCSTQTITVETNESSDEFSYTVPLTFKDATGSQKMTKVTFVYTKQLAEVTPQ